MEKLTDKYYLAYHEIFCRLKAYESLDLYPHEIRDIISKKSEDKQPNFKKALELAFEAGLEVGKRLNMGDGSHG